MKKIIALSLAVLSLSAFAQVNLEQSPEVGAIVAEYKSLPKKDRDELRDMMDKDALAAQLRSDLADQKKRRDNLLDAVEQGALPLPDVAERLAKTKERIHVLELKLRDLDTPNESPSLEIDPERLPEVVRKILDDPARRREAYLTFVERIDVFPERIAVKLRVPGKG